MPVVILAWLSILTVVVDQQSTVNQDREVNSRVRYPGEEAVAAKACGAHRLMAWWIENPRKSSATLHARCAGQVHVESEVKF